jgi:hypothetical protein
VLSLHPAHTAHPIPFEDTASVTLPSWQGTNYVNVQVRDRAGNTYWAYDSIGLDTRAPQVTLQIDGGAHVTRSREVMLSLSALDATSGPAEMRFAVNGFSEDKWSEWQPFATTASLTLPNWQGTNYVNAQVRDRAGNIGFAWDSIILDTRSAAVDALLSKLGNSSFGSPLPNSRSATSASTEKETVNDWLRNEPTCLYI